MYQISKRLTIAGAFLGLACGFLLTQQPTKAATTPQEATPTTQVVKANSNVLDQNGRASCRERVYIVVVDVAYKKKIQEIPTSKRETKIM